MHEQRQFALNRPNDRNEAGREVDRWAKRMFATARFKERQMSATVELNE